MTNFQNLHYETKNKIAYITIDRPKVLNALNMATMEELRQAFASAEDDAEVRVDLAESTKQVDVGRIELGVAEG